MTERLFGTDGIRGVANIYPMTAEMALKVGRAAGLIFRRGEDRQHTILIGKDTRRSCYMLENALTAGLCSVGVNVLLTGPLPTPGVSYIARSLRCDGAVMISASHNPYQDNGIKLFAADGYKLPDDREDEIERLIRTGEVDAFCPVADKIGTARRIDDAVGRYIEFVKATFPKGMRLDGLRIVVDCSNGAAYKSGPEALRELGATVTAIGAGPNGLNINHEVGSVFSEEMRATVIKERADLGIAFDGDGDRIAMADEHGRLLDGNALLAVIGVERLTTGTLPGDAIVTTIMANAGLVRAIEAAGGRAVLTPKVGDRHVVEAMRRENLVIGGEPSGHMVFLEHNTTGDASIAALQVLATMIRRDEPLSLVGQVYQPVPECHRKVPFNNGDRPGAAALDALAREAEAALGGAGRVVVRPSGTEPIVRIMVQHEEVRKAEAVAEELTSKVKAL
jgi:phosphoglucosamine mutase